VNIKEIIWNMAFPAIFLEIEKMTEKENKYNEMKRPRIRNEIGSSQVQSELSGEGNFKEKTFQRLKQIKDQ
jgi:hypothetical protein